MVAQMRETVTFKSGEYLLSQGQRSLAAYIIIKGTVRVFCQLEGINIEVGRAGPGEIVGEMAMIADGVTASASVEAVDDVEVSKVYLSDLNKEFESLSPELKTSVLCLINRLIDANGKAIEREFNKKQNVS
jgi:CRP-like cAMP-binding protein